MFRDTETTKRAPNFLPAIIWFRALACALVLITGTVYLSSFITPIPSADDTALLLKQVDKFEKELENAKNENPFVVVFLGTSRLKNMVWNKAPIEAAGKEILGGRLIKRLLLAINWGGYQRLAPLTDRILAIKPDALVIMPEFLTEDYTRFLRMLVTYRIFHQWKIGKPLHIFEPEIEFDTPICSYDPTAEHRFNQYRDYIQEDKNSAGPTAARRTVMLAARQGIKVFVASLPKHPNLEAISPRFSETSKKFAETLASTNPNIRVADFDGQIPKEAFCDFAHINAAKSEPWVRWIISKIAKGSKTVLSQSKQSDL